MKSKLKIRNVRVIARSAPRSFVLRSLGSAYNHDHAVLHIDTHVIISRPHRSITWRFVSRFCAFCSKSLLLLQNNAINVIKAHSVNLTMPIAAVKHTCTGLLQPSLICGDKECLSPSICMSTLSLI